MSTQLTKFLIMLLTIGFLATGCTQQDLAADLQEDPIVLSQEAFSDLALELSEILVIAKAHHWFGQNDLISELLKSNGDLSPEAMASAKESLGISYNEFVRLTTDLALATDHYMASLKALDWSQEAKARLIHETVSGHELLNQLRREGADENGRCFLNEACYFIGNIFIEVYLALFCDFFCEEEALPLQILVSEICELLFPC